MSCRCNHFIWNRKVFYIRYLQVEVAPSFLAKGCRDGYVLQPKIFCTPREMFPENLISIDAVFLEELKNKQTIKQTNTHKITDILLLKRKDILNN